MVFTDLLFLFVFLSIATVVILIAGEPWEKNLASLVLTLVFMVWGRPWYFALILLPVLAVYFVGRCSEKKNYNIVSFVTEGLVWAFSLVCAVASCRDMTLSGNILAVAYLLFALKSCFYLNGVRTGAPCENNFLNLGVYLMSYEFFLINPCMDYFSVRNKIDARKTKLSNMSVGIKNFVIGLLCVSAFGLTLDRIRTASLLGDSVPWMNMIVCLLATTVEIYALLYGYMKMSSGICMINGICVESDYSGYGFNLDISKHLSRVYPDLAKQIKANFGGKKASMALLILSAVTAGVCMALNTAGGVLLSLVLAGLAILFASYDECGIFEKIFALLLVVAGVIYASVSSLDSLILIGNINFNLALSEELLNELAHSASWAVISAVMLSQMPSQLASVIRMKLTQTQKGYTAYRVLSCAGTLVLLVVAIVATVSYS